MGGGVLVFGLIVGVPLALLAYVVALLQHMASDLHAIRLSLESERRQRAPG